MMSMLLRTLVGVALLAAGTVAVHAEAPYYNPRNPASPTRFTTDYELYRTIGCPGRELLDPACKVTPAAPTLAPPPAPVPAPPADGDRDGVSDDNDRCPTTPAGRKVDARGCEMDGDRDGVIDGLDRCPTTPPGRKVDTSGCEMDADGDGVVDGLDRCPTTPPGRKVDAYGCEPDADGDGVADALDQCPATPAGDKVDGKGCTLLDTLVLKGVNFDNDSAALRPDAHPILDEAVAILKRYPAMKVEVAGHTDSTSSGAYNQTLSENRARAVMDYFMSQGVDATRLSAKGYGEEAPIADNATAEGRALNRRVELRIR
jgi:outer membrane protein OmpA-like peptidoglycan-associated protein